MDRLLTLILALLIVFMYCDAASKCPKMEVDPNNEQFFKFSGNFEDWWFAYTVSETYINKQTGKVPKDTEVQFLLMEPGGSVFKDSYIHFQHYIDPLFKWVVDQNTHQKEMFDFLFDDKTANAGTLQKWERNWNKLIIAFNDQSDHLANGAHPASEDEHRSGKMDVFASHRKSDPKFDYSHAKMIMVLNRDRSGFILAHSFPNTPYDIGISTKIKAVSLEVDTYQLFQHMLCFSFDTVHYESIRKMLMMSSLKAMYSNIPIAEFQKEQIASNDVKIPKADLSTRGTACTRTSGSSIKKGERSLYDDLMAIVATEFTCGKECTTEWNKKTSKVDKWSELITILEEKPFDKCTLVQEPNGLPFKIISHAPRQKKREVKPVNNNIKKKKMGKVVPEYTGFRHDHCDLLLRPLHWEEVAKVVKSSLSTQCLTSLPDTPKEKKAGIPSLVGTGNKKYFDVEFGREMQFPESTRKAEPKLANIQWPNNNDHSKWAVADNNNYVCIGDANWKLSQLYRPGNVFCFENANLKKELKSMFAFYISEEIDFRSSKTLPKYCRLQPPPPPPPPPPRANAITKRTGDALESTKTKVTKHK